MATQKSFKIFIAKSTIFILFIFYMRIIKKNYFPLLTKTARPTSTKFIITFGVTIVVVGFNQNRLGVEC